MIFLIRLLKMKIRRNHEACLRGEEFTENNSGIKIIRVALEENVRFLN